MIRRKRRIKKAKYNGASFYIEDDETCGGRRIVTHEFPFSETPATEDLGKRAQYWQIQGFVGGALYKQDAEKLQDALERPGVGTLDHPYIGKNQKVRCSSYRRCETNREWGVIWFSMCFTEAGELPEISISSITDQTQKNQTFLEKTVHAFESAITDARESLQNAADTINSFSEQLEDSIAPFVAFREGLGDVMTALAGLREVGREILSEPAALLNAVIAALNVLIQSPMDSLVLMNTLGASITPLLDSMVASEQGPLSQPVLQSSSLSESVATVILIQMSTAASRNAIQNRKDREKVKSIFLSTCDQLLDKASLTFEIVQSLRSETYFTLQRQDEDLNLKEISVQSDTNLLLLSYELYGDLSQVAQLAQLNPHLNPSFVPQGTSLEVL